MRVILFIIFISNLIYVPIGMCRSIKNCKIYSDNSYSLIFDIAARYEIDFTRLLIQSLIILVLLGATYTNSYSRFISYMKSSETIELDQSQSKLFFVICLCLAIIVAGLTFRYYILD